MPSTSIFFIKINEKYIGLQIKPVSDVSHIPQIYKERQIQKNSHAKFTKEFGGKVFYIFSTKKEGRKEIANSEVVEEIKTEIEKSNFI